MLGTATALRAGSGQAPRRRWRAPYLDQLSAAVERKSRDASVTDAVARCQQQVGEAAVRRHRHRPDRGIELADRLGLRVWLDLDAMDGGTRAVVRNEHDAVANGRRDGWHPTAFDDANDVRDLEVDDRLVHRERPGLQVVGDQSPARRRHRDRERPPNRLRGQGLYGLRGLVLGRHRPA